MGRITRVVAILAVLAFTVAMANADTMTNVVTNGTFQTTASLDGGWVTIAAGSDQLTGWTVGGDSVDVISGNGTVFQASPAGGNLIDLSGLNAGLSSQVLNTEPVGSLWTISFYLSANPGNPTVDKTLQVTFGTQSWTFVVPGGTTTASNMNWQLITISNILVDFSPTTLTFASLTQGAYGPVIAGISVVDPPAVPEPASLMLLGSGLAGLVGMRRFKRS